jgi:O-antigen/teichoic acid export membrane protein
MPPDNADDVPALTRGLVTTRMDAANVHYFSHGPTAAARAFWSALDAGATPASMLIMLAGLVRTLSAADYGVLVVALAASGLSMSINPAIATTTTKFVSEAIGYCESGRHTAAGVVAASLLTVVAIDVLLILGTATLRSPLAHLVFGAATARAQADPGDLLLLAVAAIGFQQIDAVLAAALRGMERFRRQAVIEVCFRCVLTVSVVTAAWVSRNVRVVLLAQCMVCCISAIVRAAAVRQVLPGRRLLERASRSQFTDLFRYGGWMWLGAIAGIAYTSVDRIIIGHVLGPAAAGRYNVYVQITQLIHFVPSSLFAFALPAFSRLTADSSSSRPLIARAYMTYLTVAIATALGIGTTLMLAWPYLLEFFAGNAFEAGRPGVLVLLAVNFFFLACNVIPYYLLLALGGSKPVSLLITFSMLVGLALMALFIPRYGLEGAGIGRLAYGLGTLAFLWQAGRALRIDRRARHGV